MIELDVPSGLLPADPEAAALARLVLVFLRRGEARDLEGVRALAAPDYRATYPGGRRLASVEDWMAGSKAAFRSIRKTFAGMDAIPDGAGGGRVYCHGTLEGVHADGRSFAETRFIDRFEVHQGLIRVQDVWNDLAAQPAGSRPNQA